MKRALVLGGGGIVGVAWESGLVAGLQAAGIDLTQFDTIVGTSAGALIGSQVTRGMTPYAAPERTPAQSSPPPRATVAALPGGGFLARDKVDAQALGAVFTIWMQMQDTTLAQAAAIGAVACRVHRADEGLWVEQIDKGYGAAAWPERALLVTAVDTESGERRVFDRDSGVELARALAASCAVPGMFPAVTIDGRLYMDGQVHSSTHADVLVPYAPREVWIAMPTNTRTAPAIGGHAERMLAREVELLRAAGCTVHATTPDEADAARMGPNLMDARRITDAYETGLAAGAAWGSALAD